MSVTLHSLSPLELLAASVWEFDRACDGVAVRPVRPLPVSHLEGRLVATHVTLANGDRVATLLGNLSVARPELNQHFATLTFFRARAERFELARYHDPGRETHGPAALARFLGLPLPSVFPVTYNLAGAVDGPASAMSGKITAEPVVQLSRSELIELALP
jgi:hypothetical protein